MSGFVVKLGGGGRRQPQGLGNLQDDICCHDIQTSARSSAQGRLTDHINQAWNAARVPSDRLRGFSREEIQPRAARRP